VILRRLKNRQSVPMATATPCSFNRVNPRQSRGVACSHTIPQPPQPTYPGELAGLHPLEAVSIGDQGGDVRQVASLPVLSPSAAFSATLIASSTT
jgi:hypothetical protein